MKFLVSRLMHVKVGETAGLAELHKAIEQHEPEPVYKPVVYRIRIKERTGRFEKN